MLLQPLQPVQLASCAAVCAVQVDEVRGVMVNNIQLALKRGEQLDTLVDKTDDLSATVSELHC